MTLERYLWWMVLAWCWWRAWTANCKAEAASRADTSGTRLLERAAESIEEKRRLVGADGLVGAGRVLITHSVEARIGVGRYRVSVERVDG